LGRIASQRFSKTLRLRRRGEFLRVQGTGRKVAFGPLLALALHNAQKETRLGLTVSTKVGNAVVRNRIRRRLREMFRRRREQLPPGLDLVFVARAGAALADYEELERAFLELARQLKGLFP
jgi:ribonuclease P protein component